MFELADLNYLTYHADEGLDSMNLLGKFKGKDKP